MDHATGTTRCSTPVVGLSLLLAAMMSSQASAAIYYCDPVKGKLSNDGKTPATAWSALESVVDAGYFETIVRGGDTVSLMTGNHGYITLRDLAYSDFVTITSGQGQRAGIKGFRGYSIEKVILDRLWVTPLLADDFFVDGRGLIWIGRSGSTGKRPSNVQVKNCRVFSVLDSSKWTAHDWATLASFGITMYETDDSVIERNLIFNVYTGIGFNGNNLTVRGNWVDNFAGDGMFGGGKGHVVEDNLVTDVYEDDTGFHNDGLQFYYGGAGNSFTIRRNVIVDTTDPARAKDIHLQGITSFQEDVSDSVVENNYVISSTTHGISFTGGGSNDRIVNNTVYGFRDGGGSPMRLYGTWNNTIARNNLVTDLSVDCPQDHNIVVDTPDYANQVFMDPSNFGFRLKASSPAVDAGSDSQVPEMDFEGDVRPDGAHADIGADER
ncbi:MAG: right-handed parallel beta-helix repeat-containing protein [Planctomycetota bacterium]